MYFKIKPEIHKHFLSQGIYLDKTVFKFIIYMHVRRTYLGTNLYTYLGDI